ncbi:hypothetical protein ABY58_14300 [Edwardsiella ictaluri]|nr:hypothetical protein ABY58_14300 [Edwardsiella ictaluri]
MGIRRQGKLRDHQHAAAGLAHVEVHFTLFVAKDAVAQYLVTQALCLLLIVASLHPQQHQQARADLSDKLIIYHHTGMGNPLN